MVEGFPLRAWGFQERDLRSRHRLHQLLLTGRTPMQLSERCQIPVRLIIY